ncbi:hypothetical protein [Bradyrhizobium ganzhouense]|uniref:hypothetical protein n=1 Tax=Bradyrhizobium ganzhouense TaxID=1179767 RepID=UPI003CEE66F4
MMSLDWRFTAQDDEILDPTHDQYCEAFVMLDAMYCDMPPLWCPGIHVDNNAGTSLGRGTQAVSKKKGSIYQTRSFAAKAPVVPGGRFGTCLATHSVCGSLRYLAAVSRKRTIVPHSLCSVVSQPKY